MRAVLIRVLTMLVMLALLACGRAEAQARDDEAAYDLPSEIVVERIFDGCIDCPDQKLILRREGGRKYGEAEVTRIDLHTKKEVRGKLGAYFYNNLLKLIEAQGFFGMKDSYAMGWEDSTIVNLSVAVGDRRKLVKTRSEGDVPAQLWGIYYAIYGAAAHMDWGVKRQAPAGAGLK